PQPAGGYPGEDMIPNFGSPLPTASAPAYPQGAAPQYGQGFITQPPATSASMPQAPRVYTPMPANISPEEQRVMKLEQTAFGSVYPEHELDDRLDHLEREVLGTSSSGSIAERISKLEGKLSGDSAFGSTAQPPVATAGGVYSGNSEDNTVSYTGQAPGLVPQRGGTAAGSPTKPPKGTPSSSRPKSEPPPPAEAASGPQDANAIINAIPFDAAAGDYFNHIHRYPRGSADRK